MRSQDLAELSGQGIRAQPVRRFYPATSEPVPSPGGAAPPPAVAPPARQAPVALLDSGVDAGHPWLAGRVARGYDAVDRDTDPAPGADRALPGRRERSGTALAGLLAAGGERVRPIRVAGLQAAAGAAGAEDLATTDRLLAGLERAVDPDGDGACDDRARVAVVGVNAPYAGFAESAEASAVRRATALGTLIVAPAGNEGAAKPPAGTVGSPGAAGAALTAGALAEPGAAGHAELELGGLELDAALLGGAPPADRGLRTAGPVRTADPEALLRGGGERITDRLVVVAAGANPSAQAAAAAAAGARAVLLARPGERPLPAMPAGRVGVPVLGVTGAGAEAVLEAEAGEAVRVGRVRPGRASRPGAPPGGTATSAAAAERATPVASPFSSRGPALSGEIKPDVAAPGAALTAFAGGGTAIAGGSAIAAVRTAAEAARLARALPRAGPEELAAALAAAADPVRGLPVAAAGTGALRRPPAQQPLETVATPPLGPDADTAAPISFTVRVRAPAGGAAVRAGLEAQADPRAAASVTPRTLAIAPRQTGELTLGIIRADLPAGAIALGRLVARDAARRSLLSVPWRLDAGPPAPVPIGPVRPLARDGRVEGVGFTLGAFSRGDPQGAGTSVSAAERALLEIVDSQGRLVRRLTPPGGARDLLPAEYAYRLPRGARRDLPAGELRFRVRARGPRQREWTEALSDPFAR